LRSAVDIGTNTVRLLLGEVVNDNMCSSHYLQTITRLGGGMTNQKGLTPEAMERTLSALKSFVERLNTGSSAESVVVLRIRQFAKCISAGEETQIVDIIDRDESFHYSP